MERERNIDTTTPDDIDRMDHDQHSRPTEQQTGYRRYDLSTPGVYPLPAGDLIKPFLPAIREGMRRQAELAKQAKRRAD